MTNQIQTFNFTQAEVRTSKDKNGEPLFCLSDVAKILDIQNSRQIVQKQLDSKGVYKIYIPTNSGNQDVTFISEPNLYRVIFRSNKPDAVKFQNWIFEEVIPQIRKTGSYNKEVDIVPLTLVAQWADLLVGKNPTDTLFEIKERYQVGNLTELQESHISNEIQSLLEKVDQYISQNKKPSVELKQVNTIVGALNTPYELRLSLHAIVKLVSKCYLDNVTAYRTINARLEHACKLANLDWITHDRLSTALRELADITDDAVKHRDTLQQIDKNAIVCLSVVGNNAIGFMA
jgi:prophage antirepressor-like protein